MQQCATHQRDEPGIQGFQAFYEDNLVSVYRFVFTRVRHREEAEDLTSQIFLKALRYLDPKQCMQRARSWLFKIAQTTVADYWRSHYRASISSLDVRLEVGWEGPHEEFVLGTNQRAAERVDTLLEALPERYREVLRCRFLFNLSIRETAATMGSQKPTSKSCNFAPSSMPPSWHRESRTPSKEVVSLDGGRFDQFLVTKEKFQWIPKCTSTRRYSKHITKIFCVRQRREGCWLNCPGNAGA